MLERYDRALADMRGRYDRGAGALALLEGQKAAKAAELADARTDIDTWRQVQALLSKVSDFAREQLKLRIEETVTAALQTVFGDQYEFRIVLRQVGGQPAAEWQVASRYGEETIESSPEDSNGGGLVDVISLALRLAVLELARPSLGGPLVMDEPGKMISAEYAPHVADFLKAYAARTGRQGFLVTHNRSLAEAADVAIHVAKNGDLSEVTVR